MDLLPVVAGGLIAIVGGFAGALLIRWLDGERYRRDRRANLDGVINVVLAELAENDLNLKVRIDNKQWLGRFEAFDRAYRDAEPLFGRELSAAALQELFKAYAPLRSPTWLYSKLLTAAERLVQPVVIDPERAQELRHRLAAAAVSLRSERPSRGGEPELPYI